jgi:methylated-DNA-[protein]-cysteine S-methyltransferase
MGSQKSFLLVWAIRKVFYYISFQILSSVKTRVQCQGLRGQARKSKRGAYPLPFRYRLPFLLFPPLDPQPLSDVLNVPESAFFCYDAAHPNKNMNPLSNEVVMNPSAPCYELVETPFGEAAMVWAGNAGSPRVLQVFLPASAGDVLREIRMMFPGAAKISCETVTKLGKDLLAFTEGKAVSFDQAALDLSRVPPFHKKVLRALTNIPRGKVSTYGSVAGRTGAPGGTRAAGQGCAKNPFPLIFPCHRVVRSGGSLGGFGGGLKLKRALLEMEGVQFDTTGKVEPEFILW